MRTSIRTAVAVLLAVVLAACADGGGGSGGAAATVNGERIDRGLLERVVAAQLEDPNAPTDADERAEFTGQIQREVLSTLIAIEIVAQLAADQGVDVSDDEIDELYGDQVALYEEQAAQTGQDGSFDDFLGTIGLTEDEYRDVIVADLARRDALTAVYATEVTDEQVRARYDEQLEGAVNSRHILVDTEEEADDVLAELEDGTDFAELAQERSNDPGSGEQGGDLGPLPPETFVDPFADALREGEVGEVLGPIETEFGFHVIEVLELPSFEEQEEQIRAQLEDETQQSPELAAAFDEAFANAEVTIGSGLGEWDPEQGQVVDPDQVGQGPDPDDPGLDPGAGDPGDPMGDLTEEELQQMLEDALGEGAGEGGVGEGGEPADSDAP